MWRRCRRQPASMNKSISSDQSPVQQQLETLMLNLPGVVYRCANQPDWPMEFVSIGCKELTGYPRSVFEDKELGWGDIIHPDDREHVWDTVQAALAQGEKFDMQYRLATADGAEKWVWERGCGIFDADGELVSIEGYVNDISELKAAEAAVQREREAFAVTLDHAPMGIVTFRIGSPFITCNRAFCTITGYSADELRGLTVEDITHPDDWPECAALADAIVAGETRKVTLRKRYTRKDGSVVHVGVVSAVVQDDEGQPDLIVGIVEDLTPRLQAEAEARSHRDRLAHVTRLSILGEMSAAIAHEINQPLTAISLFAQAGRRLYEAGDYERMEEVFEQLSRHARRAGDVIQRTQAMARRQESSKEVVSIDALLADITKLAEAEARIRDISIVLQAGVALPPVFVDPVQIQQVALNLLRNGMDAMQAVECRKGSTIHIRARALGGDEIEVSVIDSGAGVSDEAEKALFAPFSTTKESGMGMGLSISRAIVTAHGGRLTYRPNENGGAIFCFTLPVYKGDS